jgi:hypothetical protein
MYIKKYNTALAGLMCVALGACSTMERSAMDSPSTGEGYSEAAGTGGAAGASSTMGASESASGFYASSADRSASGAMGQSAAMSWVGVVQAVEMIPRSQATGSGTGTYSASKQSGGSGMATGASGDMVYRLTLRLDDGTIRSVTQEAQPSIQAGDRARLVNGMLQRD